MRKMINVFVYTLKDGIEVLAYKKQFKNINEAKQFAKTVKKMIVKIEE